MEKSSFILNRSQYRISTCLLLRVVIILYLFQFFISCIFIRIQRPAGFHDPHGPFLSKLNFCVTERHLPFLSNLKPLPVPRAPLVFRLDTWRHVSSAGCTFCSALRSGKEQGGRLELITGRTIEEPPASSSPARKSREQNYYVLTTRTINTPSTPKKKRE